MTSHAQPEALRLADEITGSGQFTPLPTLDAAAAELRRLHAEIERLTLALKKANEQAEHFEREWYLCGDKLENLTSVREKRQPLSDEQIDAALQAWFGNVLGNSAGYRYRMRGAIEAAHNITGEPA